jgi:hypothetical protein
MAVACNTRKEMKTEHEMLLGPRSRRENNNKINYKKTRCKVVG